MQRYNKALVALVGATAAVLSYFYSNTTWLPPFINFLTVAGVYQVRNK